jgi:outer membrane lipoprotein SlyB
MDKLVALSWLIAVASIQAITAGSASAQSCNACGVVTSIQRSLQDEEWTPLGAMSSGPTLADAGATEARSAFAFGKEGSRGLVMVGAAGGAVYAKRPSSYKKPRWDVTIKMDDGTTRTVQQKYEPFIKEGDRVRVNGTQLELADS